MYSIAYNRRRHKCGHSTTFCSCHRSQTFVRSRSKHAGRKGVTLRAACGRPNRQTCRCVIATLAALVPPPRAHLTRFHGVFAPNANLRAQLQHRRASAGSVCAK
ncbi:MAG: hypothetical protein CVV15_07215 [Gammaproteobacteria bacterium HGW-Gammaproteobacteria-5]|nr:MAG: hypothetical protein CVV15_07215 [Gammaproteobacteria bacterium HGW-Gammaproteobacteria-5]